MGVKLKVKSRKIEYEIEVFRKYTIISGNSGTGKTTLVQYVNQYMDGISRFNAVQLQCELNVAANEVPFRSMDAFENFIRENNGIIILDELSLGSLRITPLDVARILKAYDRYFILITREFGLFKGIPVAADDMMKIHNSGKYNVLEPLYPKNLPTEENISIDCIITEDKKSGALFMKHYFPQIEVVSAEGKDTLGKYVYKMKNKGNLFLLYDSLSAGFVEGEVQRVCRQYKISCILYRPLSFEKYLLDSPFLKKVGYEDVQVPMDELEEWYEHKLKELLPHGYTKSELPVCIKENCATMKKKDYPNCGRCSLQDCTRTKRELVVYDIIAKIREA